MSKEELEEVIEYEDEYYEENFIEEQEELSDNDQVEQDSKGQVKFKSVNHHKRAEANEVESDGETATYANYALEYFGYRCALSGEKFVAFDNAVEREGNAKLTTNLSAEHIVALTTGGNDIIPNIVPTVLQYNLQKNGYYILDWWPKARNIEGKPIYNEERLLKLVNYMLKSLQIRKELGIKERPREYKKRLLKPNAIDEYLAQGEIASGLISDVITATEDDIDGKKILTKIPESEGSIPSLSEQKENEIKITEEMFLVDAIDVLEREKDIPQEIIESLKELYKEVEGEIPFEVEVRRNILSVLKEMGIEENKYIVANTLLINTNLLEKARENKEAIQNIIKEYLKKQIEELREVLTEDQIKIAISNMPNVLFEETTRNRIKFWKDTRGENFEEILQRGGENSADSFIDNIIKLQMLGVDTNKLVQGDTIESLTKKSEIPTERLEEAGLNPKDNIGNKKNKIAVYYKKEQKGEKPKGTPPTQEQVEELLKLGISLESINSTEEFISQIKILQELGVDTNKLVQGDTIESLAKKSGIPTERLEEAGLNPKYNIGSKKNKIAGNYRQEQKGEKPKGTPPTQEQVEELLKLGISLESINSTEEFISQIKILQELGVDTNKLVQGDTIESLAKKSGIPTERLEEAGLNSKDNIGIKKNEIAIKYRKKQKGEKPKGRPPTDEQVKELSELGISLEGNSKKKIKDTVQQNKNNLSEVMQVGKRLEVEILMAEKVAERSTSDGRGQ